MHRSPLYLIPFLGFLLLAANCHRMQVEGDTDCVDPAKGQSERPCPKNWDPVCGCDGLTYGNPCLAENAGVKKWKPGACEDCLDPEPVKRDCPDIYQPVCGCDGKTYPNECSAGNAGVRRSFPGTCEECLDPDPAQRDCPDHIDPVCGCNGTTYTNACQARNAGVKHWVKGPCS